MYGICDTPAMRRLKSETFDIRAPRRLKYEICDTLDIRSLPWETCGTLAPGELVHDESYDTLASKGLKHQR